MTSEKLALREPADLPTIQELSPREVVEIASEQARVLMDIVEKQKLYEEIQKKKYLYVEGWQTIGAFTRTHALTDWVNPITGHDGEIIGYEAKVSLFRDGQPISAAIMSCGFDEFPCRGKEGSAKHKAAKSAAQTWAESKAYRMKYGYIAKLAGYEATPAEEMINEPPKKKDNPLVATAKEHGAVEIEGEICAIHGTEMQEGYSKKTKQNYWYHDIEGERCFSNVKPYKELMAEMINKLGWTKEETDARLKDLIKRDDLKTLTGLEKYQLLQKLGDLVAQQDQSK